MAGSSRTSAADSASLDPKRGEIKELIRLCNLQSRTLEAYYAMGEQMHLLEADTTVARPGTAWRKEVAKLVGQSNSSLTHCLQFYRSYQGKKKELAQLQRLDLGWMHMVIALSVRDKKQRHELLRRASQEGWGQHEMRREARQLKGRSRGGGRPRRRERSRGCLADATELSNRTGQWSDFYDQAWAGNEERYLAEQAKMSDEARGGLERVLNNVNDKLQTLQRQCQSTLKTVKALQSNLARGK